MTTQNPSVIKGASAEQIEQYLKKLLVDQFDVDPTLLSGDVDLFNDLGIDSIDAVDLLVYLKDYTGVRIPPEKFKSVRTIDDVVTVVRSLMG